MHRRKSNEETKIIIRKNKKTPPVTVAAGFRSTNSVNSIYVISQR